MVDQMVSAVEKSKAGKGDCCGREGEIIFNSEVREGLHGKGHMNKDLK